MVVDRILTIEAGADVRPAPRPDGRPRRRSRRRSTGRPGRCCRRGAAPVPCPRRRSTASWRRCQPSHRAFRRGRSSRGTRRRLRRRRPRVRGRIAGRGRRLAPAPAPPSRRTAAPRRPPPRSPHHRRRLTPSMTFNLGAGPRRSKLSRFVVAFRALGVDGRVGPCLSAARRSSPPSVRRRIRQARSSGCWTRASTSCGSTCRTPRRAPRPSGSAARAPTAPTSRFWPTWPAPSCGWATSPTT